MLQLKKCFKLILICYFVFLQVSLVFAQRTGTIHINITEVPYLVQIWGQRDYLCTGTLVSSRHVVTAANCLRGRPSAGLRIFSGSTEICCEGVESTVSKIWVPKVFKNMDVAVLKLTDAVEGQYIRPTGLCETKWLPGATVQVYGWTVGGSSNHELHYLASANVTVISKSRCKELYPDKQQLNKFMFCVSKAGHSGSCYGDSGGPAFINGQFCGVASYGVGCKLKAVFTSVLAVRRFIEKAIEIESEESTF